MTSADISEWMAFDAIEPIGDHGAYLRAAQLTAMVGNAAGARPQLRPAQFMPADPFETEGPVLLADPKAQSDLVRGLFKGTRST